MPCSAFTRLKQSTRDEYLERNPKNHIQRTQQGTSSWRETEKSTFKLRVTFMSLSNFPLVQALWWFHHVTVMCPSPPR